MASPPMSRTAWFVRRLRLRSRRGAAGVLAVMFLSIIAIMTAAAITIYSEYRLGWDRYRMAGQIWAEWVHALDRADILPLWAGGDWTAVRDDLYGGATTDLPSSGLGGDAGFSAGINIADVPMLFGVVAVPPAPDLEPSYCQSLGLIGAPPEEQCHQAGAVRLRPLSPGRLDAIRRGAIDGGLGNIAVGGPGGVLQGAESITQYEDVLELRFGDAFQDGDLVALTHISIPRTERALHHRAPAGRPDLAGMQADLDMGGQNMAVDGTPPWNVAPADSPDVEAVQLAGIRRVEVSFAAPSTSLPDDLEPAVRADIVVARSLDLTSDNLEWAHEIGVRRGLVSALEDEALRIASGNFESAETQCDRVDALEHCVTAAELEAGNLDMTMHMEVHREDTSTPTGSGVNAGTLNANILNILSGECHGCDGFN